MEAGLLMMPLRLPFDKSWLQKARSYATVTHDKFAAPGLDSRHSNVFTVASIRKEDRTLIKEKKKFNGTQFSTNTLHSAKSHKYV